MVITHDADLESVVVGVIEEVSVSVSVAVT
jgi:hypothetical protein